MTVFGNVKSAYIIVVCVADVFAESVKSVEKNFLPVDRKYFVTFIHIFMQMRIALYTSAVIVTIYSFHVWGSKFHLPLQFYISTSLNYLYKFAVWNGEMKSEKFATFFFSTFGSRFVFKKCLHQVLMKLINHVITHVWNYYPGFKVSSVYMAHVTKFCQNASKSTSWSCQYIRYTVVYERKLSYYYICGLKYLHTQLTM